MEHLAKKFKQKCESHERWTAPKLAYLENEEFRNSKLMDLKVRVCSVCNYLTFFYKKDYEDFLFKVQAKL